MISQKSYQIATGQRTPIDPAYGRTSRRPAGDGQPEQERPGELHEQGASVRQAVMLQSLFREQKRHQAARCVEHRRLLRRRYARIG